MLGCGTKSRPLGVRRMIKKTVLCVLLSFISGSVGYGIAYTSIVNEYDMLTENEDHNGLVQLEKKEACRNLVYAGMDKPCPEMEGFEALSKSEQIEQTELCQIWADKGSQYSLEAATEILDDCDSRHGGGREIYHCYQPEPLLGSGE